MKKEPSNGIISVKKNVDHQKLGPGKLKKYNRNNPKSVIIMPPVNSHFHATKIKTSNNNQGIAFGLFLIIPAIPPPNFSEPERRAKINTKIPNTSNVYLAILRNIFAV